MTLRAEFLEGDSAMLRNMPGYDGFTDMEKQVLALYPYYNSRSETCKKLGIGQSWIHDHEKASPMFKEAMTQRGTVTDVIFSHLMRDLLGKTYLRLNEMLDNPEIDPKALIKVIEHIHKVTKIDTSMEPQGNNFINTQNVIMFRSTEPPAVAPRVTAQVIDGVVNG